MDSSLSLSATHSTKFDPSSLPTVETRVRFYKLLPLHEHEKPYECEFSVDAVQDARKTNIEYDERAIAVRDVRGFERYFDLEINGFEIKQHTSALDREGFGSRDLLEKIYLPECVEIVRQRYGASEVLVLGFTIRDNVKGYSPTFSGALRPVKVVHVDQSQRALRSRVAQQLGREEGERILSTRRCLIINIWRPISDPIEEYPLCYCDAQTVDPLDCVAVDLVKRDQYEGESLYLKFNPTQQFYYLSRQRPHEIALMMMADSNPDSRKTPCKGLPHAAFPLPLNNLSTLPHPRESIEVRLLVII